MNNTPCLATEIDGPPIAYWELTDGFRFVRLVFKSVGYQGFDSFEEAGRAIDKLRERINEAFTQEVREDNTCYIIWRTRPEILEQMEEVPVISSRPFGARRPTGKKVISLYCRFATSPPLPDSFWSRHEKKEGEALHPAGELK
jgi:hypothetical protein